MIQDPNTVGFAALGPAIVSLFFFPRYTGMMAIALGGWGVYLGIKSKSMKCFWLSLISAVIGVIAVVVYFLQISK